MVDYANLANVGQRLISQNGRTVTLVLKSRISLDVNKPWRADDGDGLSIDVKAVLIPYDEKDIDGDLVRRGDKQAYISAVGLESYDISLFDELIDNNVIWKIKNIEILNPGELLLLYILQLRK